MADEVELIEFAVTVALGDGLRVLRELADAGKTLLLPELDRGCVVELVLVDLGVDRPDDDTVILGCPADGDVTVDDVLEDLSGITLERITVAASAGAGAFEGVARADFHVGEQGPEVLLILTVAVQPHTLGNGGQTSFDAPGDGAGTVTAVAHDGVGAVGEDTSLGHTQPAAVFARAR